MVCRSRLGFGNTLAGVAHRQGQALGVQLKPGAEGDRAAIGHGVAGVVQRVDHYPLTKYLHYVANPTLTKQPLTTLRKRLKHITKNLLAPNRIGCSNRVQQNSITQEFYLINGNNV